MKLWVISLSSCSLHRGKHETVKNVCNLLHRFTCKQFLSIGHLELDSVPNIHKSFHFKLRERSVTMTCDVDGAGM